MGRAQARNDNNNNDDVTRMHKVWEAAAAQRDSIIAWRRHLHRAPELSFEERHTADYIQQALDAMGVPWERVGELGVVATVQGRHAERMVALRADMDALPIQEANEHLPYCSAVPGVMHACGHDGHVAMLLGAAGILQAMRSELQGSVKLCFQQAEERGGGTQAMIEHLAQFPVRTAFAIHLWSEMESGTICTRSGPRMAACDNFDIVFDGVGCHGAAPPRGVDPLVAATALVQNAATLMAREIDPAHAALPQMAVLAAIFTTIAFSVLSVYALAAARFRALFARRTARRMFNRTGAICLFGAGAYTATLRHGG